MEMLPLNDVEQIVNLIARAGDPTIAMELPERKRLLVTGLAAMVDADVWLWSTGVANPQTDGDTMATFMLDGGYEDGQQQAAVYEALTDPKFNAAIIPTISEALLAQRFTTMLRSEMVSEADWANVEHRWLKTGLEHTLLTMYPISVDSFSGIGFHRRRGKPNFSERDRSIVHVAFSQVDWLHRHGTNLPAKRHLLSLSPRERQVLMLLLRGLSKKEIAVRLQLSEHTVGDYMKQLHRHFEVSSRAELQAVFHMGTLPPE